MVVVALIGILSALAVPSFQQQIEAKRVQAALVQVESLLSEARDLARRRQQCVDVRIAGRVISIQAWATCTGLDPDGLGTPTLSGPVAAFGRSLKVPALVQLGAFGGGNAAGALVFNPRGGTVHSTPTTLQIRHAHTHAVMGRLTVYPAAGTLRLEEGA